MSSVHGVSGVKDLLLFLLLLLASCFLLLLLAFAFAFAWCQGTTSVVPKRSPNLRIVILNRARPGPHEQRSWGKRSEGSAFVFAFASCFLLSAFASCLCLCFCLVSGHDFSRAETFP